MKGGSKASDLVMATEPKLCDGKVSPVITGPKIQGNVSDFKLYRTTGGGKKNKKDQQQEEKQEEQQEQLDKQQEQLEEQQEQLEEQQQEEKQEEQQKEENNGNNMMNNKNNMMNNKNNMMNNKNNEKEGLKTKPKRKSSKSKKNRKSKNKNSSRSRRNRSRRNRSRRNRSRRNRSYRNKRKNMNGGSPASDLVMRGEHPGKINYCPQTNKVGGGKKTKSKRRLRKQKGSGSDWKMTLYSRGPVNTPNQNPEEFRMFTQTAEFIPNEALRAGKFTK